MSDITEQERLILKQATEIIQTRLKNNHMTELRGLCTFMPVEKPARVARNPRTGEPVDVPAHRSFNVKTSESFKKALKDA